MISKGGYSAIELLVVLAILSVIVTLGLVNYSTQIPHYELRDTGRTVISDLRKIRQRAVAAGTSFSIGFYPDFGGECDESYAGQDAYCEFEEHDELVRISYKLPQRVQFGSPAEVDKRPNCTSSCNPPPPNGITFPSETATFNKNGMISVAGAVYLTNHPTRNEAIAITVNFTGRIKLWHWVNNEWE